MMFKEYYLNPSIKKKKRSKLNDYVCGTIEILL